MYEELKKAAEAATPGPWYEQDDEDSAAGAVFIMPESEAWAPPICRITVESNAAFIAAANPSAVLALIAENERLRALPTRNALIKQRDSLIDERDQLNAENEALRKDAERFRFIQHDADSGMRRIYGDDWLAVVDAGGFQ